MAMPRSRRKSAASPVTAISEETKCSVHDIAAGRTDKSMQCALMVLAGPARNSATGCLWQLPISLSSACGSQQPWRGICAPTVGIHKITAKLAILGACGRVVGQLRVLDDKSREPCALSTPRPRRASVILNLFPAMRLPGEPSPLPDRCRHDDGGESDQNHPSARRHPGWSHGPASPTTRETSSFKIKWASFQRAAIRPSRKATRIAKAPQSLRITPTRDREHVPDGRTIPGQGAASADSQDGPCGDNRDANIATEIEPQGIERVV